ncbi:hypothetical protein [Flavobacterium sp.]|uniref:hypothetical protein n=1 Tax=Flavobacterium sp. TaxID=239 RepID=UPI0025DBF30A|nr:hypothetical protein [Flavobacterium sp.]
MNTREKILKLNNEGNNIPEICELLNIGKGTVGYHLKQLGIKWDRKRTEKTKKKISESQIGKTKKKRETKPKQYKRSQEGYINPKSHDYWPILNGDVKYVGTYHNSIRGQLKRFIVKNNIIPYICDECKCDDNWRGKKMPLILDHKNGIRDDNRLDNLRFLCSNCDSIQDTYKGRNKN